MMLMLLSKMRACMRICVHTWVCVCAVGVVGMYGDVGAVGGVGV